MAARRHGFSWRLAAVLWGSGWLALSIAAAQIKIYVAPNGNDAWSGRQPKPQGVDGPLRTLSAARDKARALRQEQPRHPIHIILRGGIYFLTDTLTLGPEDSGRAEAPVIWQAYPGEIVWISGGQKISGLQETRLGQLRAWQATLPDVKNGAWNFRQLFVQRQGQNYFTRRFRPHKGMLVVAGLTYSPARQSMPHRAAQPDFIFFPGDLQPWANLSDVEIVALHSWSASRLKIKHLDMQNNIVTFTAVPTFRIGHWYKDERNPYYVENIREELKEPGQFYLDRPTGVLTYLPRPEETLENTTLVAPRLERLIVLRGDPEKGPFVEHVRFVGLRFAHTEWPLPEEGYDTSQGQPALSAAIELTGARVCGLERCVLAHTGAYGVALGLGCAECFVRGCYMFDLGGGGVKIGDHRMNQQALPPLLPVGNIVENSCVIHFGVVHYSANGIWAGIVRDTKIRHNEIAHGPYTGIAVGWNWSAAPTSAGGNLIEANHVHHVMELVQDGGGIYTLGRQPGTVIRGNLIHDNHRSRFACADGQVGLYFDQGSSGFLVGDNIVYDVAWNNCQIAQNQNTAADHEIRQNYLGVRPNDPHFPQEIAARAGLEPAWRDIVFPVEITPNPVYAMQWPALPPVRYSLDLSFEEVPVGQMARRWTLAGAVSDATFAVTEELAAAGQRCLKITDKAGLAKPFYPYAYYRVHVPEGPVVFECDFRQGTPPDELGIEFRDYDEKAPGTYSAGPSVTIQPDGAVIAAGERRTTLPAGQWSHLQIAFTLGPNAPKEYTLSITPAGGTPLTWRLPFVKPDFAVLTDLYLISNANSEAACYLDNLKLTLPE